MRLVERLQLAIGGLANGLVCGIAGALSVCALGGMVLPKLDPAFGRFASADLFVLISLGSALAGFVAGLVGGHRVFRAFCALVLAGPLSLGFALGGLFLGAPAGFLIRLAMGAFGQFAEHPLLGYAEHDILVGCELGMVAGALGAVRLFLWPPVWMAWAR
ncbi:MAG: hypothetical protein ACLQVI_25720 [Polyangiaceae bacterium]